MPVASVSLQTSAGEMSALQGTPVGDPRGLIFALHGATFDAGYYHQPLAHSSLELASSLGYEAIAVDRPGYGAMRELDQQCITFTQQLELLSEALTAAVADRDLNVVLTGHSTGGMLALSLAAEHPENPIVGVEASGCGAHWQPGIRELFYEAVQGVTELTMSPEDHGGSMFGRDGSYDPALRVELAKFIRPATAAELLDSNRWSVELLPVLAPKLRVPVQVTLAGDDAVWRSDDEAVSDLESLFSASPTAQVSRMEGVGHAIESHSLGRTYQLRQLAFVEESLMRARLARQMI